ncbi:MAG: hypothetical protein GY821_03505 [Gammaproteobacteria bacterium]|nr:hypothetical protein [Gammaproteobacteria bacterium]
MAKINTEVARPCFTPHTISTSAAIATSVYAADLDGDGDQDILSSSFNEDEITWYENDGLANPTFTEHVISTSANGALQVFAIDVNGDTYQDIISISFYDNKLAWYENDGLADPTFTAHTISTQVNDPRGVYALDIDGDGDIDIVVTSRRDDEISWFENDGSEGFTKHVISDTAESAFAIYADDLDGDGDQDIISISQLGGLLTLHENDGNQNFTQHVLDDNVPIGSPSSLYTIDIDQDGRLDILASANNEIVWYRNKLVVVNNGQLSMDENEIYVVDVATTDLEGDYEAGGLVYSLDGGEDAGLFSINATTGVLSFNAAPDFETPLDGIPCVTRDNVYGIV